MSRNLQFHSKSKSLSKDNSLTKLSTTAAIYLGKPFEVKPPKQNHGYRNGDSISGLNRVSSVDLVDSIPSTNLSHSKPASKNSFFSSSQIHYQKYTPKGIGSAGDSNSAKFFKNFRIHENSKTEGLKYSFSSHADASKERKLQVSPSNSNYQTPRSTTNQNNYNVTVININKMDINNFKINEQNFHNYTTLQGTNTPEDPSPANRQVATKEKELKIIELRKEIRQIKANINNLMQEKQQLNPEDVIEEFYNKLQIEELLRQLLLHSKENGTLDSKELGKTQDAKVSRDLMTPQLSLGNQELENKITKGNSLNYEGRNIDQIQQDNALEYGKNDSLKDRPPTSSTSNQSKRFLFDDKHMEAPPKGGGFKRHFVQIKALSNENNLEQLDKPSVSSPLKNQVGDKKIEVGNLNTNMPDSLRALTERFEKIMNIYQQEQANQIKKNENLLKKLNSMLELRKNGSM